LTPAYNSFFAMEISPEEFIQQMAEDTKGYWETH
jgi:hypothetical protein